ncbi:MAG: hypothetical protein QOF16_528 [Actinomycetota bacterium]|nr:hypothetical protein [Actinomycetota bacterium]MEA2486874.1 hypothetical protein [Actinomycetota bacterium]
MSKTTKLLVPLTIAVLMLGGLPAESIAASASVTVRDNYFSPQTVHVDPGDTVVWTNQGSRVHTVTSDTGDFDSGNMSSGATYQHTFAKEGYYYYHCKYHGAKGQVGMWGVVIVGNPKPPGSGGGGKKKDARPTLRVPKDYKTIQKAVNHAKPGSTVVIAPGVYHEAVSVKTNDLIVKGVDRFRTVLNGRNRRANGFLVDGANHVTISNLTVRNYTGNGVFFNNSVGYNANHIDAIKDRTYGIYAFNSYRGTFAHDFAYGSGDSGYYIGSCLGCGAVIEHVTASTNFLGYSGTNATGVVIRNSMWVHNGAGIAPNTLPTEDYAPNRGTTIIDNVVMNNNYDSIPAAGISEQFGIPYGTGIWLIGVDNTIVKNNTIMNHDRYGVLITESIEPHSIPMNNRVWGNTIRKSGKYALAWTGEGMNNCFGSNHFTGPTGPPDMQTLYACKNRPFAGAPFPPVQADVAASLATANTRPQKDPPDPRRPRCQKGAPDCKAKNRP